MLRHGEGTTAAGTWGDWATPEVAWRRVLAAWRPAAVASEQAPLLQVSGRVLAVDVAAPFDMPPFDRSTVDGYALRAADCAAASHDAPVHLSIVGAVPMGAESTVTVAPGQVAWVATGSMMPRGADSVVMVEQTELRGDAVAIGRRVTAGDNVTPRAEELHAGARLLPAGRRLRPQDVAALASAGYAYATVRRRPVVSIICSGDELLAPGEPLEPGRVYDANSWALAAQIEAWGGAARVRPRVADREEDVRAALEEAVAASDVVLLSGGSSVGVKDLTATVIQAMGQPGVVVHGMAIRPGRPTLAGVVRGVLVVGIPGNPVTAMIACEVLARPALEEVLAQEPRRVAGVVGDYTASGRLTAGIRSLEGRQDYVRVRVDRRGPEPIVHPVPGGSGAIRSMVDADGLVIVPLERSALEAGEIVEVRLF